MNLNLLLWLTVPTQPWEAKQIRRLLGAILNADTRTNLEPCSEIPYATEQGITEFEVG